MHTTYSSSASRSKMSCPWSIAIVGMLAILFFSGCTTFSKPNSGVALDQSVPLQGSDSAEVYKRIRQAKAQNAIVLQVIGDSEPIRVLPLPPDGTPVFVSDLLKQTGVQEKFGRMLVVVYRSSAVNYEGAKMEVRFDEEGETVRPETDYSLQSGDRVKIVKDPRSAFSQMLDQIIPANASRAIVGR